MTRILGAALALTLLGGAATAGAQIVPRPVRFAVGGGMSGVAGDISEAANAGWHGMAALDLSVPLVPVGVRVDGSYHAFGGRDGFPGLRIMNATANATFSPLPLPVVKPYFIGGVGMYNAKADVEDAESTTRMGFNAGAGLRFDLLGLGAFAEARFHHVPKSDEFATTQFYPLTVGLRF